MRSRTAGSALVTGGAGFVGQHLIDALLATGCRVMAVDNLMNGRREHVTRFAGRRGFAFLEGDVSDGAFIRKAMRLALPDTVYHLAALHFIPYCVAHPAETLEMNVVGTQRVLDAFSEHEPEAFVLASTADVYAAGSTPHAEGDEIRASNVYGLSKIACEQLLELASYRHPSVRFICARFFNVFGPGETNPHVLPDILDGLAHGPVLRLGNLSPRRDYVHAFDVSDALIRLAAYSGRERVFNVGTGVGTSVGELVALLSRLEGREIAIEIDPDKVRPVERESLVADISRITRETGWRPRIALAEGIRDLLFAQSLPLAAADGS